MTRAFPRRSVEGSSIQQNNMMTNRPTGICQSTPATSQRRLKGDRRRSFARRLRDLLAGDASKGIQRRSRRQSFETLEQRVVLDGHGFSNQDFELLFAPGTPQDYIDSVRNQSGANDTTDPTGGTGTSEPFSAMTDAGFSAFQQRNRWGSTATDGGGLSQGDATTITWSIVPDGTPVPGFGPESAAPSTLRASLDTIYTSIDTWLPVFQQAFDRLSEVSGINYVYEPEDDGATFSSSNNFPGQLGVRGDVRISGHPIDNNSGILAYNFFPNVGDMVIDTADIETGLFSNTNNNSRAFRNMLMHEAGHGLGFSHVESNDSRFLMEPFIDTSFDGPQFDDILGFHRGYGDFNELAGNDSVTQASDLGTLVGGETLTIGAGSTTKAIAANQADFLSIDGSSDVDFFKFTVETSSTLSVSLEPLGPTYNQGPQGGSQSQFNAKRQSNLALAVLDQDGATVLESANGAPIGIAENISDLALPAEGTYYLRVTGGQNEAQMYQLELSTSTVVLTPGVTIVESDGFTEVAEADYGDSYTVVLDSRPTDNVAIEITTGDQVVTEPAGFLFFTPFDWNEPQTVNVSAVDDLIYEGDHSETITHRAIGADYDDVAVDSVTVVIIDNEEPNDPPIANDDTASTLSTLPVSINVIENDTDVDGVIVGSTVSVLTQPGNGSVVNNFDGTLTYTPVAGFSGTDSFSYTVRDDDDAESNVALVSIVVEQGQILFEDSFEGFADAWTQDNQGDWFLSSQRATDGIYSLEVDGRANNATVELIEGVDISAYSKALLTFDWLIERGFDKGEYLTLDVSGDGGASWALDVRQLRGNESEENVWNPGYGVGESTRVDLSEWIESTDLKVRFRSSVSGSREDANVDNVKIWGVDLDNANNSPIAVDDSGQGFSTDEDNSFIIGDVLSNDSDPDVGDVISIESIDTSSLIGELLDLGSGDFRYDPAGKFDALAVGESTTDSFLYTITDGRGGSDTATVTIEITGVNDAPDAVDDLGTGFETEFETAFTTASVLSNDTDPDTSDTLTISEVDSSSLSGTLVDNGDGTFLYTPEAGFQGEESFSYTITDGNGGSDSASVTITVNAPNEAPVAVDDNDSTNSGSSVTTNVIENDTDIDGVIVASTVTIVSQPSNGMLVNHGDGTITYTPIGGFVGTDSYTYTVRDDDNAISNVATVTIEVTQPPSDQVLFYDSFEGFADQWTQDSQGDWFLSAQRATDGFYSLEVDGRASDATVEFVEGVDISGFSTVILSFDWLIERGFDRGEYLSLDISGDGGLSWTLDVMQLRGNESEENVWNPGYGPGESTSVNLAPWLGSTDLKVRFRSLVSASREDANVDNVKIVGSNFDPLMDGGSSSFSEFTSGDNQSQTGSAADSNSGDSSNTTFGSAASTGDGRSWLDQMTGGANGSRFENSADFIFNNWFNEHQDFDWLDDDFLTGGRLF